jgi:DNA invertase Pin-like site-specific DNA recombinase
MKEKESKVKNTTVAIYTRVSSEEQAKNGVSLQEQKDKLTALAKLQGWDIIEVYTDDGYTGATDSRPELQRLMADAKARLFNKVVVAKLDRFFRNTRLQLDYLHILDEYGVTLYSLSEGIDTEQPGQGKILLNTLATFAEMEHDRIGERVKDFRNHLAAKGQWSSGKTTYGYDFDKKTKELVTDILEAPAIRYAFETFASRDIGTIRLAELMNKEDFPLPVTTRRKKQLAWTGTTIRHIITHPAYKGQWKYKTPAIVSPELWNKVQLKLRQNKHFKENTESKLETPSAFKGMLRCGICGKTLRVGYNHSGQTQVWECLGRIKRYHMDGSPRCTLPRIKAFPDFENKLTKAVWNTFYNPGTYIEHIKKTVENLEKERTKLDRKLKPMDNEATILRERRGRLNVMFEIGQLKTDDYKTKIKAVNTKLHEVELNIREGDPMLLRQIDDNTKTLSYYRDLVKQIETDSTSAYLTPIYQWLRHAKQSGVTTKSEKMTAAFDKLTNAVGQWMEKDGVKMDMVNSVSPGAIQDSFEINPRTLMQQLGMAIVVHSANKVEIQGNIQVGKQINNLLIGQAVTHNFDEWEPLQNGRFFHDGFYHAP